MPKGKCLNPNVAARNFRQLRGAHADDVVRPTGGPLRGGAWTLGRYLVIAGGFPILEFRRAARGDLPFTEEITTTIMHA